jgi:hypothetical protein
MQPILKLIKAKPNATRKTKNHIHNYGPIFGIVEKEQIFPGPGQLNSRLCTLTCGRDGWLGWFPLDEIEVLDPPKE